MLDRIRVPTARLVQQFLQRTAVVQRLLDLRDEFVRNVDADAAPLDPTIEDVAGVLVAPRTGGAVFAHARTPPKTQRPQRGRPQRGGLRPKPALDLGGRFNLGGLGGHAAYDPHSTHTCQAETANL